MPESVHDWSFVIAGYSLVVGVVSAFVAASYRRVRRLRRTEEEHR
jgi:hypothetical protein